MKKTLKLARRPVAHVTFVLSISAATVFGMRSPWRMAQAEDEPAARKTVTMTIDYGDGVQKRFTLLRWRAKMTVMDAMKDAAKHRRGIEFKHSGAGSTTLVTQIDDLKNKGAGGGNWIYRVNGKLGDRSIGVMRLKAADDVLWTFGKYR